MLAAVKKVLSLLESGQKRHGIVVVVLMFLVGILDIAGVASIVPFLAVLSKPEVIETQPTLASLYELSGAATPDVFMRLLGLGVFGLVVSGIVLKAWTFYEVTKFTRISVYSFSNRLLTHYLAQPYEWYLSHRTSDLGKSILDEVGHMVSHTIGPLLRVVANGIVAVFLLCLLLYLEPIGAIITFVLMGGMFGLAYFLLRGQLNRIGADRRAAQQERFKTMQEAMMGIKEVKMAGLEDTFKQRFRGASFRLAKHQASLSLVGEMPRYVLEAVSFGGALILILWVLWTRGGDIDAVLPLVGAFAFAGLKLMPTLQALFRDIAQISFGRSVFSAMHEELTKADASESTASPTQAAAASTPAVQPMPLEYQIELRDVAYRYPTATEDALHNLSLSIPAKSSCGFVGTTGAGKTTLVDILLGLLRPASGTLLVDGTAVDDHKLRSWQRSIGYVPQYIYLTDDSIASNIAFGVPYEEIDWAQVRHAAALAHLDDVIDRLPDGYETIVGENGVRLSGGQRQRIGIARALYRDPEVIVFDEAMNALDTVTEKAVLDAINGLQGEKTLLTITHRLASLTHCDQIFVLKHGRIEGQGTFQSLARDNSSFRALAEVVE